MVAPLTEDTIRDQLRELQSQVESLNNTVSSLDRTPASSVSDIVPALVNFLDNSDFSYADLAYISATYADDDSVLSQWYGRTQATASSYTENTTVAESGESIRRSAHSGGARTGMEWLDSEGTVLLTGGYRLGGRMPVKYASAGNYMAVRMQISNHGGVAIEPTIKAKLSIWDNTDNRIVRGSIPTLTLNKVGAHAGGTVKREYILEIVMPDGKTFYSNTVTPDNITNTVAVTAVDTVNTVRIQWAEVTGSVRYRLYRRTPLEADTHWYLVDTVTNGSTLLIDSGGTGGGIWTIPTLDEEHRQYQEAISYIDDIGTLLQTQDVINEIVGGIRIPFNFVPNGNQFVQIEFVKSDYSATTTTEIPADGIRIDKVGLSYTNGRWSPSARDLSKNPAPTGTPNPPPAGGGGGGNPPDGGGGEDGSTCVRRDCPVLVWSDDGNHFYMPASQIVIGDRLVAWDDSEQRLAPTRVDRVIDGVSTTNYVVIAEDRELPCSFTHRVITHLKDFETGTRVRWNLQATLTFFDRKMQVSEIDGVEVVNDLWKVRTFRLQKGRNNYIANGFFSHNLKPIV